MRAGQSEHCVRSRAPAIFLSPPARTSACLSLDAACCGSMRACARGFCNAANAFGEGPRPSERTHCLYSHRDTFALGAYLATDVSCGRLVLSNAPVDYGPYGYDVYQKAVHFAKVSWYCRLFTSAMRMYAMLYRSSPPSMRELQACVETVARAMRRIPHRRPGIRSKYRFENIPGSVSVHWDFCSTDGL